MASMQSQMDGYNKSLRGGEHFPDPFLDMASTAMPESHRNVLDWCLPPGTLIELDGLQFREVQDVVVDDLVPTRGGTVERVRHTGRRRVNEPIVSLAFAGLGNELLQLTGNHKIWRAKTAKLKPNRVRPETKQLEQVRADKVVVGDWFATPLPVRPIARAARFHGYILGMYVAEGCTVRDGDRTMASRFSLGEDDESTGVLGELLKELQLGIGREVEAYTPPTRPDVRIVVVSDPELPDWLKRHAGELADKKQLSADVLGFSDETLLALLGGWLDGDGWTLHKADRFAGVAGESASRVLISQLLRIANCVGLTPSLYRNKNDRGFAASSDSQIWRLTFGKEDAQRLLPYSVKLKNARATCRDFGPSQAGPRNVFIADGNVYRRVREVSSVPYSGYVYNFEVENDHSYIANGVTVANCEFIFMSNGTYRMAMERIISYFLTDIEIGSPGDDTIGDDEKEKYSTYLRESLDGLGVLQSLTRDRMCYGNAFASVVVPFHRFMVCPKCGNQHPLRVVHDNKNFNFSWKNCEPRATCQNSNCDYTGKWKFNDVPDTEDNKIRVKRWNPKEIEIVHDYYSDETAFLWRIPEDYCQKVIKGSLFELERAPQQMILAVKNKQLFRFADEAIFHMKEPTLAGIRSRGWGISRVLTNFRQAWYVQVLRRYNEAIALDYVIPFRVITPADKSGNGMSDPLMSIGGGDMRGQVNAMLAKRRQNPASWHTLSFPIQYQALGGEATAMAPKDLLDQGQQTLLNEAGTPVELYQGTLTLQTAPVALRLFEATWQHLVHDNDRFLTWLVRQLSRILSWEVVTAKLRRVTYADDMNRQMAALQMAMGQQISQSTALKGMGFSWRDEQRQIAEEARFQAEVQAKVQEEMQQASFGQQISQGQQGPGPGAAPPGGQGGAPAGGGDPSQQQGPPPGPVTGMLQSPNQSTTPQDLLAQADSLAQQLLGMPESQKDSELRALKQKNEVLHSLVKAKMQQYRQKAQTAGGSQVLAQQFGGGGGGQGG